ncbi:MAG: hypothetical protein ACK5PP_07060 [Acidimicrobiales bacterium]
MAVQLAALIAADTDGYVIRLPGLPTTPLAWVMFLLAVALVFYALIRGIVAVGEKVTGMAWKHVALFWFVLVLFIIGLTQ